MGECIAHTLNAKERTQDVQLKPVTPFSKMMLLDNVRKGLRSAGFLYPTTIQATAIPLGKAGLDLLIQSKSGTGKTLIFGIVVLEMINPNIYSPQALIVVPTREIAVQIEGVLNGIGKALPEFRVVSVIGGVNLGTDRKRLQGAKVVVGTPKRVLHLIRNDVLNTTGIKVFVLDEADKMYSMSFRQDILRIRKSLPHVRQTIACSATFCDDLDVELSKTMRNPLLISTENRATLLVGIKQFVYELPEQKTSIIEMEMKLDALRYIFSCISFKQCLIFASSQMRADSYCSYLQRGGWPCELMSGAQSQTTRLEVFRKFQEFKTRILVTTDLMSRGVDSEHVNLVINLELPIDVVTYLHRIGRAGRFGSYGIAISFIASEKDRCAFRSYSSEVGCGMSVLKFPQKSQKKLERDLWDFNDFNAECQYFGLFDTALLTPLPSPPQLLTSLTDSQENKENKCNNITNSSVDTKTFQIDSKDSAINLLDFLVDQKLTPDSHPSSSQQYPSSNTIDDASSIAADSVHSSQQDISSSVMNKGGTTQNLLKLLVDPQPNNSKGNPAEAKKKPPIDVFEAYQQSLLDTENDSTTDPKAVKPLEVPLTEKPLLNIKSLLIDAPHSYKAATPQKDIFSDYANFEGDDSSSNLNKSEPIEIEDVEPLTLSFSSLSEKTAAVEEELHDSSFGLNEVNSITEVQHMVSPVEVVRANSKADVVPPLQNALPMLSYSLQQELPSSSQSANSVAAAGDLTPPTSSCTKTWDDSITSTNCAVTKKKEKLVMSEIVHYDIPPVPRSTSDIGVATENNEFDRWFNEYYRQLRMVQDYLHFTHAAYGAIFNPNHQGRAGVRPEKDDDECAVEEDDEEEDYDAEEDDCTETEVFAEGEECAEDELDAEQG